MSTTEREPSSVVWSWREAEDEGLKRLREARESRDARRRGILGGALGLAAAAAFFFLLKRPAAAAVIVAVGLIFTLLALLSPLTAYRVVTRWLDRFAHAVGTLVSWIAMTVVYYLVLLPLGLILRARGKLRITPVFASRQLTYWISREGRARTPESYRRQF